MRKRRAFLGLAFFCAIFLLPGALLGYFGVTVLADVVGTLDVRGCRLGLLSIAWSILFLSGWWAVTVDFVKGRMRVSRADLPPWFLMAMGAGFGVAMTALSLPSILRMP